MELETSIREMLEKLRVHLQADGGDLEVVDVAGTKVKLRLQGACGCCPHATMTLKNGIERILREQVSADIEVERVMD
ncbi:MAG: NifU family protein [Lentisphaeria bacterium]